MKNTPEILKQEDIDLVSLASPHIMDSKEIRLYVRVIRSI